MTFDLARLGAWGELPFFAQDLAQIADQLGTQSFLPPPALTFRALERCQPDATKVIILGQDPYHTPGKADGLAFSIPDRFDGKLDSLGNVIKELRDDLDVDRTKTSLDDWADQGVLLLNALSLTVAPGQAGSHRKLGWQTLTRQVLARLTDKPRAYLLWGNDAQIAGADISAGQNLVMRTAHPSPLAARRGFFGSRPFSTVNHWLIDRGDIPINWADPQ